MLSLLIIGGGIHGTFLSHVLTAAGAMERDSLRVLDPHDRPLAEWERVTAACGMRFLRSPSSHNLEPRFNALRDFVGVSRPQAFIPPYMRPSRELFNEHCRHVVRKHRLEELRLHGRALDIEIDDDGVTVTTDSGEVRAERVLFCLGRGTDPFRPDWAEGIGAVRHVYDPGFHPGEAADARQPLIVGGGIGAVQLACALADRGVPGITILAREPIRVEQFDSDPCYIGPRCLPGFLNVSDPAERSRTIRRVRHPGTVPSDVAAALELRVRSGAVRRRIGEIESVDWNKDGMMTVRLGSGTGVSGTQEADGIRTDRIVLATGFRPGVPEERMIRRIARRHGLPLGPNGYPLLDRALRWHPRVFCAGYLAELELGPPCGNIIGAHLAARRLVPFFGSGEQLPPVSAAWTPLASGAAAFRSYKPDRKIHE